MRKDERKGEDTKDTKETRGKAGEKNLCEKISRTKSNLEYFVVILDVHTGALQPDVF